MLLFSTVLDINDTLTKDAFIQLVIDWNQGSTHKDNVIKDIRWNGEHNIRFGDENMWLAIEEYRNQNIIAARYQQTDSDGAVWATDYVMNFTEWKMAVQLDRSFLAEALAVDPKFSTPHFIAMLADAGYLKQDGELPVSRDPVLIGEKNISLLSGIINGNVKYRLPVVYVSKLYDNRTTPVDVRFLASKLKGVAHVLVLQGPWLNNRLRDLCHGKNEYYGAIGIYFPNPAVAHKRYLYRALIGYDEIQFSKTVRDVIEYANNQNVPALYTWQGVNNALLRDRWSSRGADLIEAQRAMRDVESNAEKTKKDAEDLVEGTVKDITDMGRQISELTKQNEALQCEVAGLRAKLGTLGSTPLLYTGNEDELFAGEIKELILTVLEETIKADPQAKTRRADVIRDILQHNDYKHVIPEKAEQLKKLLKGYKGLTPPLRSALDDFGFKITDDGKHYKLVYRGDPRYHTTMSK